MAWAVDKGIEAHLKWQQQDRDKNKPNKPNTSTKRGYGYKHYQKPTPSVQSEQKPLNEAANESDTKTTLLRRMIEMELDAFGGFASDGRKITNREAYIEMRVLQEEMLHV